jgi:hypothetical protein
MPHVCLFVGPETRDMAATISRIGRRLLAGGFVAAGATLGASAYMDSSRRTVECGQKFDNSAFVFIKPHANTTSTQDLVKKTLLAKGIKIVKVEDSIQFIYAEDFSDR